MTKVVRFAGLVVLLLSLAACGGSGGGGDSGSSGGGSGGSTNRAPVASAGPAQSVLAASTVQLDGTASSDPDGNPLNYLWTLTSRPAGSTAALSSTSSPRPSFVADQAGNYVVTLIVNDGSLPSSPSTVTVTAAVANAAPVANAGPAQNVRTGQLVTLDGRASSDVNGDPLQYAWTLTTRPGGSAAVLSAGTGATVTFTADVAGSYVATLVVNDGALNSTPSTVTITASAANVAPVANAGAAQDVLTGALVRLNGGASSDANGDTLSYRWSLATKPAGSTATLAGATTATPSFTADLVGTYVASLVVNDGQVDSAASSVTVTATNPIAPLPIGAGTYVQLFPAAPFYALDDGLGTLTAQPDSCRGYDAADARPDGIVLAVSLGSAAVFQVDVLTGRCRTAFAVAEPMKAIAVASDGTIVTVSGASGTGTFRIYRYSADGLLLGSAPVSGVSNQPAVSDLNYLEAIDFAPNGNLYATNAKAIWRLDPVSGAGTLVALDVQSRGDFDIDGTGVMRSFAFGVLYRYNSSTWTLIDTTPIARSVPDRSPLVRR